MGVAAIAALGMVGAGAWLWREASAPAPPQRAESQPLQVAQAPAAARAASGPSVGPPSLLAAATPGTAALDEFDLETELHALFGRSSVLALLRLEDFPRRVVATVDQLGRAHAPPSLWPVVPASGRLGVDKRGDAQFIAAANERRYTPHIMLIETVDMRRVVDVYRKLYPRLQQAYADLGYPNRDFNARLVEVIDLILSTPQTDGPLPVELPEIRGPVPPQRPWLLYRFDDPDLQALASGQKILLRLGPVNGQRLRANLAELRELVTSAVAPR
jgi:Protein of unknown function (DUF3014)